MFERNYYHSLYGYTFFFVPFFDMLNSLGSLKGHLCIFILKTKRNVRWFIASNIKWNNNWL